MVGSGRGGGGGGGGERRDHYRNQLIHLICQTGINFQLAVKVGLAPPICNVIANPES